MPRAGSGPGSPTDSTPTAVVIITMDIATAMNVVRPTPKQERAQDPWQAAARRRSRGGPAGMAEGHDPRRIAVGADGVRPVDWVGGHARMFDRRASTAVW